MVRCDIASVTVEAVVPRGGKPKSGLVDMKWLSKETDAQLFDEKRSWVQNKK